MTAWAQANMTAWAQANMTAWAQARKEYLSQFQIPISLLKPQRLEDFRMTGSPELTLKKSLK